MRGTRRAVLGGSLAAALGGRKWAAAEPVIGTLVATSPPRAVPALRFSDAAGAAHGVADFAGQGLVLNFWATWCGPCVAEMPSLARLATLLQGDRIAVVPVSSDTGGAAPVRRFYEAHKIAGLGIWLDPNGDGLAAVGGLGLPTTLIVDRRGREVARISGAADWLVLAARVRGLCDGG